MSISPEQQTLWLMDYLQGRTLSEQILLMDYFQLERQQSPVDSSYFDRHAPTAYAAQLMRNRWWSATPVQEDSSAQSLDFSTVWASRYPCGGTISTV